MTEKVDAVDMKYNEIKKAVDRIRQMELLFDHVCNQKGQSEKDPVHDAELQSEIRMLKEYYTEGMWQQDYEMDEQNLLPSDLKRGVLSQDGLYDLLCEMNRLGE